MPSDLFEAKHVGCSVDNLLSKAHFFWPAQRARNSIFALRAAAGAMVEATTAHNI